MVSWMDLIMKELVSYSEKMHHKWVFLRSNLKSQTYKALFDLYFEVTWNTHQCYKSHLFNVNPLLIYISGSGNAPNPTFSNSSDIFITRYLGVRRTSKAKSVVPLDPSTWLINGKLVTAMSMSWTLTWCRFDLNLDFDFLTIRDHS